jgi:drug/metabolite transporter (DMT)-like permease
MLCLWLSCFHDVCCCYIHDQQQQESSRTTTTTDNMSPPSRTGSTADDKPSYTSVQLEELISNQPSTLRTASPKLNDNTHGFLTTTSTRTGPVRPLSPDTLSDFSFHEYPQSSNLDPSPFPPPSSPSSPSSFRHRLRAFYTHNLGLLYMLLAQLFGTAMNVATRLLEVSANHGRGMHPLQILFTRMALTVICGCAYMSYTRTPHFPFGAPEVRRLLVVRGFAGFFGVFGMYYSLMYLPLAEATVITFLAPGLASWACSVLLGEPFTRAEKIGGGVSLLGVVLIARPAVVFEVFSGGAGGAGGETVAAVAGAVSAGNATASSASNLAVHDLDTVTPLQRLCAVGVALVGVLGAATAYTVLRWIGKRAHPLISVNYFATTTFFVCLILQSVLPEVGFLLPSDVKDWGWLVFLGVCGFVMVSLDSCPLFLSLFLAFRSCFLSNPLTPSFSFLAISPRLSLCLREIVARDKFDLRADAVRPRRRPLRLRPLAGLALHCGFEFDFGLGDCGGVAEECWGWWEDGRK